MKTLLVATDYSKPSLNAVKYAADLAVRTKSKLILFHVFHAPIVMSEVPVVMPSIDEMEEECIKELGKIEKKLKAKYGIKLHLDKQVKCGLAVDEIIQYVKESKTDLVVVGMQGAGLIAEKLSGSTSTSLINKADFPVLIINEKVKYKSLKKIVLATDYAEIKNPEVLNPLKKLVQLFKSHIYILNVLNKADNRPTITEAIAGIKLEKVVEDLNHSFHYIKNNDVIEGLNEFVVANKIDLTVMIPRKHSLLKNILKEPTTKRMAFHTETPLLTLHE